MSRSPDKASSQDGRKEYLFNYTPLEPPKIPKVYLYVKPLKQSSYNDEILHEEEGEQLDRSASLSRSPNKLRNTNNVGISESIEDSDDKKKRGRGRPKKRRKVQSHDISEDQVTTNDIEKESSHADHSKLSSNEKNSSRCPSHHNDASGNGIEHNNHLNRKSSNGSLSSIYPSSHHESREHLTTKKTDDNEVITVRISWPTFIPLPDGSEYSRPPFLGDAAFQVRLPIQNIESETLTPEQECEHIETSFACLLQTESRRPKVFEGFHEAAFKFLGKLVSWDEETNWYPQFGDRHDEFEDNSRLRE